MGSETSDFLYRSQRDFMVPFPLARLSGTCSVLTRRRVYFHCSERDGNGKGEGGRNLEEVGGGRHPIQLDGPHKKREDRPGLCNHRYHRVREDEALSSALLETASREGGAIPHEHDSRGQSRGGESPDSRVRERKNARPSSPSFELARFVSSEPSEKGRDASAAGLRERERLSIH